MNEEYIKTYLKEVKQICDLISIESILSFAKYIKQIKESDGRVFFAGVGGSAGNCSHAVNDFRKLLGIECYCVTDNVSELTARINDESWEESYSNWLKGSKINSKDALVVFSVGGGSEKTSVNLKRAIDLAVCVNAKVLSIVSRDGGYAAKKSDACILIPVVNDLRITPHAEEWQAVLWHMVVNGVLQND